MGTCDHDVTLPFSRWYTCQNLTSPENWTIWWRYTGGAGEERQWADPVDDPHYHPPLYRETTVCGTPSTQNSSDNLGWVWLMTRSSWIKERVNMFNLKWLLSKLTLFPHMFKTLFSWENCIANGFFFFLFQGGGDRHIREAFTAPNDLEIEEIQMDDDVL